LHMIIHAFAKSSGQRGIRLTPYLRVSNELERRTQTSETRVHEWPDDNDENMQTD
jgi:hypothetical protein